MTPRYTLSVEDRKGNQYHYRQNRELTAGLMVFGTLPWCVKVFVRRGMAERVGRMLLKRRSVLAKYTIHERL
jgi:hypothetical protein